jgi:hypothetical protein
MILFITTAVKISNPMQVITFLHFQLEKLGSECPFIGPEPAYGISAGIA